MEKWERGRIYLTANEATSARGSEGSNPSFSANFVFTRHIPTGCRCNAGTLKGQALVAQRIEHLTTDEKVACSNHAERANKFSITAVRIPDHREWGHR
jgi:hypothetical protein